MLIIIVTRSESIGGKSRGPGGPWPLLNFKTLHRNSIFSIENHLSLAKGPLTFSSFLRRCLREPVLSTQNTALHIMVATYLSLFLCVLYVTGFWKTVPNHTITEIHSTVEPVNQDT